MLLWSMYQFETRESLKLTNIVILVILFQDTGFIQNSFQHKLLKMFVWWKWCCNRGKRYGEIYFTRTSQACGSERASRSVIRAAAGLDCYPPQCWIVCWGVQSSWKSRQVLNHRSCFIRCLFDDRIHVSAIDSHVGKTTLMLPLAWIMGLLPFRVGLSVDICTPKIGIVRIRGSPKIGTSFRRWTPFNGCRQAGWHRLAPKGKLLGAHMVGWKYLVHWIHPLWLGGP